MRLLYLFLFCSLFILSCTKEDKVMDEILAQFIGEYTVSGFHRIGIVSFYDEEDNFIGTGYDTLYFEEALLRIDEIEGETDTVLVSYHRGHGSNISFNYKVKSALQYGILGGNSQLSFDVDRSDYYKNFIVEGNVRLNGDVFTMDYIWNTSDTYTDGALPTLGKISAEGLKVN